MENGENLIEALAREIKEESGIDVAVSDLIGVYSNIRGYIWHDGVTNVPTKVMLDFKCRAVGGEPGTSEETSASGWFGKKEALELISAPAVRARYEVYLNFRGQSVYMAYETKPDFDVKLKRTI
ncbi:MAG: ADP-ribose pyrophosphatase [Paenibacillus sp.]|nr:ADP-ribose pyrophosphatase [Paenibacillus sp.]